MTDDKRQPGQVRLTGETRVRPDGNVEFVVIVPPNVAALIEGVMTLGSTLATEDDVAGLRQEMREMRERSEAQMQELRGHLVWRLANL